MARISITFLFFILRTLIYGQELQYGLILPEKVEREGICCIYAPKEGFQVYARPGGTRTGVLTRNPDADNEYETYYQIYFVDGQTGKAEQLEIDPFREVGNRIWSVTYFERRDGFVRVYNTERNFWLSEQEIARKGFKLTEWQEFLADNTGYLTGFFAESPGLNLRTSPDADSEVIMAVRGVINQIIPTREHSGPWTRVKVIVHKENPCDTGLSKEDNIKEELEGWIKIVGDNGSPNVWYYPRGC